MTAPGDDAIPPAATMGAGDADTFRVEFTPTSDDLLFGDYQIFVQGVPMGDGTTTALFPHHTDMEGLCALADRAGVRMRRRASFGDTFDHLDLYVEITVTEVVFTFTTRPPAQWGCPPPWAPPVGTWMRLGVDRRLFVNTWRQAEPLLRGCWERR